MKMDTNHEYLFISVTMNIYLSRSQHLVPSFQSMQLAAAVGLARLALLIGLLDQPISGSLTELPVDVVRRQVH